MRDAGAVTRTLIALARTDLDDEMLAQRICEAYVDGFDVDGAALSLLTALPTMTTLWATDDVALRLEELQFGLNEGACIEAATTGAPVLVPDLRHGTETARWPIFAEAVAEQTPVVALFALPLQWGAVTIGVLNLYRRSAGVLDPRAWRDALGAADAASLLLLGRRTRPPRAPVTVPGSRGAGAAGAADRDGAEEDGDGWWQEAMVSHPEVHQATGMVVAQLGIGPEDALARLRAHAFATQRLLSDVARDVVARRLRFTEEMR